jgi:hypothetical protein
MINKELKLALLLGFISPGILLYLSAPAVFLALIFGLLFIPPILVLVLISLEGAPLIVKELRGLLASGKQFLVISMSQESITLEPQFR